jgi:hypothetical protein
MNLPIQNRWSRLAIILLLATIAQIRGAVAQEADQFEMEPWKWRTPATPTYYGAIFLFRYPAKYGTPVDSGLVTPRTTLDAEAYYDAWQIGYRTRDYGTVFTLTFRPLGRDIYSGPYLDIGTAPYTAIYERGTPHPGTFERSRRVYGIGYRYMLGYGHHAMFSATLDADAGITKSEDGDSGYFHFETELGLRIPISATAFNIGASFFIDFLPPHQVAYNTFGSVHMADVGFVGGIGLCGSVAVNLEKK